MLKQNGNANGHQKKKRKRDEIENSEEQEEEGPHEDEVLDWIGKEILKTTNETREQKFNNVKNEEEEEEEEEEDDDDNDENKNLLDLVYTIILPMYSLLYSLKDLITDVPVLIASREEAIQVAVDSITTPRKKRASIATPQLKRRRTGYLVFYAEVRPQILQQLPNIEPTEIQKEIGKRWQTLDQTEKQKYIEKALEENKDLGITPKVVERKRKIIFDGPIMIRSKRMTPDVLQKLAEEAELIDITPNSTDNRWRKFCFSFPHGGIPVPFHNRKFAMSIEGMFEGLKVFENSGIDKNALSNNTMKGIKRSEKRLGTLKGWNKGLRTNPSPGLLNAKEARWQILIPAFKYVLDHILKEEINQLRQMLKEGKRIVILETHLNTNIHDYDQPLSAAALLKLYLEDNWPTNENKGNEKENEDKKNQYDDEEEEEEEEENDEEEDKDDNEEEENEEEENEEEEEENDDDEEVTNDDEEVTNDEDIVGEDENEDMDEEDSEEDESEDDY